MRASDPNASAVPPAARRARFRSRASIFGAAALLVAGTAAVVVLIMLQADVRRRQLAVELAEWHVDTLTERMGDAGTVPLNLEPLPDPQRQSGMIYLQWPTRDEVWQLRRLDGPVIVGQTGPVPRRIAPDGRAVIVFDNGHFRVEWMTPAAYNDRAARQRARLAEAGNVNATPP